MELNEKLDQLLSETAAVRKEVVHLKESLTKQNDIIVRLIREQVNLAKKQEKRELEKINPPPREIESSLVTMFPIKTQEELESAELEITEENKKDYIAIARALLMPGSFKKNLGKIFGTDVILAYNVDGRFHKKRIQDYPKLCDILFQATTKEGWNYKYFLDDLRIGFKCAKNKHFKYNWTQRQRNGGEESEIKIEEVLIPFSNQME